MKLDVDSIYMLEVSVPAGGCEVLVRLVFYCTAVVSPWTVLWYCLSNTIDITNTEEEEGGKHETAKTATYFCSCREKFSLVSFWNLESR